MRSSWRTTLHCAGWGRSISKVMSRSAPVLCRLLAEEPKSTSEGGCAALLVTARVRVRVRVSVRVRLRVWVRVKVIA